MSRVTFESADDRLILRWGEVGKERSVSDLTDDSDEFVKAFAECVIEGMLAGDAIEGDRELEVAKELTRRAGIGIEGRREAAWRDGLVDVVKDAAGNLIIAWYPFDNNGDDDDKFAQEVSALYGGKVPAADIHMTICYLGDPAAWDVDLVKALVKIESTRWGPIPVCVCGIGRFVKDDANDVVVALVDAPMLGHLRSCLRDSLLCYGACKDYGAAWQDQHGYIPHLTIGYVARTEASPKPLDQVIECTMDSVSVRSATDNVTFQLCDTYGPETADPTPFLAARDAVFVHKAGRVISGKHLAQLKAAHEAMGNVINAEESAAANRGKREDYDSAGADDMSGVETVDTGLGTTYAPVNNSRLPELVYVAKEVGEQQYTFGPLYAPERKDAHGEWADADTLQGAVHEYVQACIDRGDNRLNIQHDTVGKGAGAAGRWVEICSWPYETTIQVAKAGEEPRSLTMPAGTIYMGVKWDDSAWQAVKQNKITGLSLGGRAVRVNNGSLDELGHMGDKTAAKRPPHEYDGGKDGEGPCTSCGMSKSEGNHQ